MLFAEIANCLVWLNVALTVSHQTATAVRMFGDYKVTIKRTADYDLWVKVTKTGSSKMSQS